MPEVRVRLGIQVGTGRLGVEEIADSAAPSGVGHDEVMTSSFDSNPEQRQGVPYGEDD